MIILRLLLLFRLIRDLLLTKIFFRRFRIIRWPFYIRCNGVIEGGKGFTAGPGLVLDILKEDATLTLGKDVLCYHRCHIGVLGRVSIGNNVLIASNVYISDHSHGEYSSVTQNDSSPIVPPNKRRLISHAVVIEDNVWIGENCSVLPGAIIKRGAIIGANSVVIGLVEPDTIVAGSPARVLRRWSSARKCWERV